MRTDEIKKIRWPNSPKFKTRKAAKKWLKCQGLVEDKGLGYSIKMDKKWARRFGDSFQRKLVKEFGTLYSWLPDLEVRIRKLK